MEQLEKILCEVLRINKASDELTMNDVSAWDSLTHMDLIVSIEEGLEIEFSMDDIMEMKDIKSIKTIVSNKL